MQFTEVRGKWSPVGLSKKEKIHGSTEDIRVKKKVTAQWSLILPDAYVYHERGNLLC